MDIAGKKFLVILLCFFHETLVICTVESQRILHDFSRKKYLPYYCELEILKEISKSIHHFDIFLGQDNIAVCITTHVSEDFNLNLLKDKVHVYSLLWYRVGGSLPL